MSVKNIATSYADVLKGMVLTNSPFSLPRTQPGPESVASQSLDVSQTRVPKAKKLKGKRTAEASRGSAPSVDNNQDLAHVQVDVAGPSVISMHTKLFVRELIAPVQGDEAIEALTASISAQMNDDKMLQDTTFRLLLDAAESGHFDSKLTTLENFVNFGKLFVLLLNVCLVTNYPVFGMLQVHRCANN